MSFPYNSELLHTLAEQKYMIPAVELDEEPIQVNETETLPTQEAKVEVIKEVTVTDPIPEDLTQTKSQRGKKSKNSIRRRNLLADFD